MAQPRSRCTFNFRFLVPNCVRALICVNKTAFWLAPWASVVDWIGRIGPFDQETTASRPTEAFKAEVCYARYTSIVGVP